MAKHPHRLILINHKTWRCTLDGCNFFVHTGLAHILVGKASICWQCGEVFILDETALRDEMPHCYDCRILREHVNKVEPKVEKETEPDKDLQNSILKMLGKIE